MPSRSPVKVPVSAGVAPARRVAAQHSRVFCQQQRVLLALSVDDNAAFVVNNITYKGGRGDW
eukprot:3888899-Pleurochrysis_carterae.AAC.1